MNVIDGPSMLAQIGIWLLGGIALVVALGYFLRPRTRRLYPGGSQRYLLALIVQATGFMLPIPIVLILLLGRVSFGFDIIAAVAVGLAVIYALRALPVTGPLLKDLQRARIEAVMERLGPRTAPPEQNS